MKKIKKRTGKNRLNSLKLPQTKRQKLLRWQTNGQWIISMEVKQWAPSVYNCVLVVFVTG